MLALFKEEVLIGYFHNETEINDYIKKTGIKRKKLKIVTNNQIMKRYNLKLNGIILKS